MAVNSQLKTQNSKLSLSLICESTQGGVRKHLRELIRAFVQPHENVTVHCIFGDRGEPGFQEELAHFKAQYPSFDYRIVAEFQRAIGWNDLRAYSKVKELLREIAPDLVHTHGSKGGIIGRDAAASLGIERVVHTPHVFPFQWESGFKRRVYLALERSAAKKCQAIVCVGDGQRAEALACNLTEPDKLWVIRNGVELAPPVSPEERARIRASLQIPEGTPCAGMVARLAPQKGAGIFLRAAEVAIKQHPTVQFLLVGGGPDEDAVRARIKELKLPPDRFRLLGHREDAERLYPAFDVLVLSSLYEGLPYVLLEAMACGVPVIATDVLGSRDVVADGVTGFLARVSDPAHIAECTLKVLNDPELHARQSAAARRHVQNQFSYDAFIAGHRKLYGLT